jgi:hypothetical protein
VGPAFAWIGVFMLPTALGWAVLGGVRVCRSITARQSSGPPAQEPIEELGAKLCMLHAKLEAAENDTNPAPYKAARIRATRGAYVDALSAACERLEVGIPATRWATAVPLAEIYRAEDALRKCGLDVQRHI